MLGVRLDPETEAGLAALARRTRRSKSDIARVAVKEYLERSSHDAELKRQLAVIRKARTRDDLVLVDDLHDDLMRDEPDYDWCDAAR